MCLSFRVVWIPMDRCPSVVDGPYPSARLGDPRYHVIKIIDLDGTTSSALCWYRVQIDDRTTPAKPETLTSTHKTTQRPHPPQECFEPHIRTSAQSHPHHWPHKGSHETDATRVGTRAKRQATGLHAPHGYRDAPAFPPAALPLAAPLPVDPAAISAANSDEVAKVSGFRLNTLQLGVQMTKPTATPAPSTM